MKVPCEVCGRKFKGKHGLAVHKFRKHSNPDLVEVNLAKPVLDERDRLIERLFDILWDNFTLDQKQQAVMSLDLDE